MDGEFDSEYLDIDAINWILARYLRWSRKRLLEWDPIDWAE